jgi:hypothetical protein
MNGVVGIASVLDLIRVLLSIAGQLVPSSGRKRPFGRPPRHVGPLEEAAAEVEISSKLRLLVGCAPCARGA